MFFFLSFVFGPFAALGATSSEASSQVDAGFFKGLGLDHAMWDALMEGLLALIVFGAASAIMRVYRKRNCENLRPRKAKFTSFQDSMLKKAAANGSAVHCRQSTPHSKAVTLEMAGPCAQPPRPQMAPANKAIGTREADAIANAVKTGKASNLPQLLDDALARLLTAVASQGIPVVEKDVATPLLHSALRACASARCFHEAIAAYDHMAGRVGKGNAGLWSVLLYCIVEAGSFGRCSCVFKNLCRQGSTSPHDFVNMVRCYAGQQDAQGLRKMLAELRTSGQSVDAYTWNRALAACTNAECALELAEELAGAGICAEGLDAVGYNTLMKYNARAGRLSRCFELRSEMVTKGLEASEVTFGILLDACVGAKELESARKLFEDLCSSGLRLNVVHCTTFIKGLVAANKVDEAASVLREMAQSSGVKPDLITYSTIVKAYADGGDVASALKMLEQMLLEGVRPDEIIYNSVLTGCCIFPLKAANVMHTFDKLLSLGMKPTTTTLSILLKGLAHSEAWTVSLGVLDGAAANFSCEPEMRLYAQLAQGCVKARTFPTVLVVFDAMLKAARRRSETVDPIVAGRFIRSCLLGGAHETAFELRQAAQRAGIALDSSVEKMLKNASVKKSRQN